jgi:prepilin-type N-terminal cleavage/methylation domain-containing protein
MSRPPIQRHGFSLLELVIVIAIIALLASIGFVAFGAIRSSQDQRNTKAAMEIARSMFNAFVNSARVGGNDLTLDATGTSSTFYLKLAPPKWSFNGSTYSAGGVPDEIKFSERKVNSAAFSVDYEKSIDFYNVSRRDGDIKTGTPVPMNVPVLQAGEDSSKWVAGPLDGNFWQLHATAGMIRRLRSSPEAKAIWSTLRDSQIMHVGASNSGQDFILDAWNHPLLFVPGSGIRGVRYGVGSNTASTSDTPWVKGDPAGGTPLDQQAVRSPDGRAFWVSAGPDGFYDTQDDNLYSFNN